MIIVGTNIPGLAPLEEGGGAVFSYQKLKGDWVRSEVIACNACASAIIHGGVSILYQVSVSLLLSLRNEGNHNTKNKQDVDDGKDL
jgi:hypothetical protein